MNIPIHRLSALAMILALGAGASTPIPAQDDGQRLELDAVTVIGSRARATTSGQTLIPVDIVTGETLRSAGAVGNELGEALALVAPSFSFPRQSNSVTSDHVRAAQLRGMNPDQVLVLVNGKRRHVSAMVNDNTKIGRGTNAFDFNTIPLSAVKRVEVMRDGASALYGSDAIAGVINIVLDDSVGATSIGLSHGLHHTDVAPVDETITDGHSTGTWLNSGLALDSGGFLSFGLEAIRRGATNRAGPDRVSPFIPQTEANLAFRGRRTHRVGDPESDAVGAWFNAERPLGEVTLYGFGTASLRETEGAAVYRYPDSNQNVPTLYPDGFRPVTIGDNEDIALGLGARHELAGWEFDHSLSTGYNRFEFGVKNSVNPSLGSDSPTHFDSGTFTNSLVALSSEARRRFDQGPFGRPAHLAAGLNYRLERFESDAGDLAAYTAGEFRYPEELAALVGLPDIGAQGAKGLAPADATDEERHVLGAFSELTTNVSERLEGSVAARYEYHDDFGSTLTGKLSLRHETTDTLSLRASVSNSFRAPSLAQLAWARRDNTFSSEGGRISSRLVSNDSVIAQSLGIPSLDEERSINFSAGLVWQPTRDLRVSADVFEIQVDDRITLSSFIRDPAVIDFIAPLPGAEGVQALSFFTNAADTRTRGGELLFSLDLPGERGDWRIDSNYSYARTEVTDTAEPPGELAALVPGIDLLGVEERNTIETATPKHRWISSVKWQGSAWSFSTRLRAYSSVVREFVFARQEFDEQYAIDVEAAYRVAPRWRISLGASNLTDRYPDRSGEANDFFGNFAYDPINPIGLNGRFIHARTELTF
ncbi:MULTISPECIES: TonB-dependent siderophore receptor [unclassified Wenzhouxiangella]|uniref:TonB-dependent receptor plug domain-containing protein n=1 Tax=unclassified Wenzhouxiangella TaxID=2613841 RepID=UPI0015F29390|nr:MULTISPECIES: TonB-dependent receptor [unclassified Wenzhouxiangella]